MFVARQSAPIKRPKLDAFTGIIDGWLDSDREVHRKQRQTAKRVFERLRDEHGFTGGYGSCGCQSSLPCRTRTITTFSSDETM